MHGKIGDGFDSVQGIFKKNLLALSSVSCTKNVMSRGNTNTQFFDSLADLKTYLKQNQRAALVELLEKNIAPRQDSKAAEEEYTTLYHLFCYEKVETVETLDLNKCQRKDLGYISTQAFLQEYGDSFVTEIQHGKQLLFVLQYTFNTSEYQPEYKNILENFCKTSFNLETLKGKEGKGIQKLLAQHKLILDIHSLLQGSAESSLRVQALKELPTRLQRLANQVQKLDTSIPLSYTTRSYQLLESSPFMMRVQQKNQMAQAAALQLGTGTQALTTYRGLVEEELREQSGSALTQWHKRAQNLNALASGFSLADQQIKSGSFHQNIAQSVQQFNGLFQLLNTRAQSIEQSQIHKVLVAKVFNQQSGFKYYSAPFNLGLPNTAQWISFQFDHKDICVDLQFVGKGLLKSKSNILANITPDRKYKGEDCQLLLEYAKKQGTFRFKIKNRNSEPLVLDKNTEISIYCSTRSLDYRPNITPLTWVESESPSLMPLQLQPSAPPEPSDEAVFTQDLQNTLSQVTVFTENTLKNSHLQDPARMELEREAKAIQELVNTLTHLSASKSLDLASSSSASPSSSRGLYQFAQWSKASQPPKSRMQTEARIYPCIDEKTPILPQNMP